MSYLDRIREANRFHPERYRPFLVAGAPVGHVRHEFARRLGRWPEVFAVSENGVRLAPALDAPEADPEARSAAVAEVLRELYRLGAIRNWYGEAFPVNRNFDDPPLLLMERAALPHFGVGGCGVHMNGYVRDGDAIRLWVARRARDKPTFPGALDHLVAGGQPYGVGLEENLIKECAEEAGIPAGLAAQARPAGEIRYTAETEEGLRPDVIFVFDLELAADFHPVNTDGEVDAFELWPLDAVCRRVSETTDFKFNCALVIIDFLVRAGAIPPDHPEYGDIVAGLGRREKRGPRPIVK